MSQARKSRRRSSGHAHESSSSSRFSRQNVTRNKQSRIRAADNPDDLPAVAQEFANDDGLEMTTLPSLYLKAAARPRFAITSLVISAVMTILMASIYTSVAPSVWKDGLTSMMNDVSILGGISLGERSPFAEGDSGPLMSDSNTIITEATGVLTRVSLVVPIVLHKTGSIPVITNDAPSGGFPLGTTVVTWTATDAAGNKATISQNVKIVDTTPPTIIAPQDSVHYVDEGTVFAVVPLGSPDVSDTVDSSPTVTNDAPSGGFPVGTTVVTWTATDAAGNTAAAQQSVTIQNGPAGSSGSLDSVTPGTSVGNSTSAPSSSTGILGGNVSSPSATAPVAGMQPVTPPLTSGGGGSSQSIDREAPKISQPVDLLSEAIGTLTPVTLVVPTVVDSRDPSPVVANNATAGGFPLGTTVVTWTATDAAGNKATISQNVKIVDTTPPTIIAPANITAEATEGRTKVPVGSATASDTVDASPVITNDAPSDGFPVGTTVVTWTATDAAGNSVTADQKVIIRDRTPPTIIAPANITAEATASLTKISFESATASDTVDASPVITNDAPSGGFPLGTTVVTWTATDAAGNKATISQNVKIVDTTPPTIIAPQDSVHYVDEGTVFAVVPLGSPDVSDTVDSSPTVTNDAPSGGFPVGTTVVTWTATDAAGNTAAAQQSVTVEVDDSGPGSDTPWADYHGVNFVTGVLRQGEFDSEPTRYSISTAEIPEFLDIAKNNDFNMLRLVVYQESYEGHKEAFLTELEYVVSEANERNLDVWIDNHQWRIGGSAYTDSIGMPASYLAGYDITGKPCSYDNSCNDGETTDPDAVHFWRDLWTNDLRSGIDAWSATADYLKAIVDRIDSYPNVIGYEILNEPQTTRVEDYANMGAFNTFIAKELRKVTQKDIFYSRDNGVVSPSVNAGWTQGGRNVERSKLIPAGVSGLVYDDHIYNLDRLDNYVADGKVARGNRADIKTIAGEWSSPNNKEQYLTTFKNAGIASTYWAFGCFGCQINNSLVNDGAKLNPAGVGYRDAIEQVYD